MSLYCFFQPERKQKFLVVKTSAGLWMLAARWPSTQMRGRREPGGGGGGPRPPACGDSGEDADDGESIGLVKVLRRFWTCLPGAATVSSCAQCAQSMYEKS